MLTFRRRYSTSSSGDKPLVSKSESESFAIGDFRRFTVTRESALVLLFFLSCPNCLRLPFFGGSGRLMRWIGGGGGGDGSGGAIPSALSHSANKKLPDRFDNITFSSNTYGTVPKYEFADRDTGYRFRWQPSSPSCLLPIAQSHRMTCVSCLFRSFPNWLI